MPQSIPLAEIAKRWGMSRLEEFLANYREPFLLLEVVEAPSSPNLEFLTTRPLGASPTLQTGELLLLRRTRSDQRGPITLGRSAECDLEVNHSLISKVQLRFNHDPTTSRTVVSEAGSQNGTTLNGVAIVAGEPHQLQDGDVLELARHFRATYLTPTTLHTQLAALAQSRPGPDISDASEGFLQARATDEVSRTLLAGKVAVVTGGGRGIGRACALRFAEEGCAVVVNDSGAEPDGTGADPMVAVAVAREIESRGGQALASAHDISRRPEVDALFRAVVERFGGVDILVCCAGALHLASTILSGEDSTWERVLAINTRGTFLAMQHAARLMVQQNQLELAPQVETHSAAPKPRGGRIITTSSIVGLYGNAGVIEYSTSKAALYGLSRSAAVELESHGVMVNVLAPMAWTRLTAMVPDIAAIPNVEELLSPSYVADVALFLASDLADGVTGNVIDVGGRQLSVHRMEQTAPVFPAQERWTPHELQRRWPELMNLRA